MTTPAARFRAQLDTDLDFTAWVEHHDALPEEPVASINYDHALAAYVFPTPDGTGYQMVLNGYQTWVTQTGYRTVADAMSGANALAVLVFLGTVTCPDCAGARWVYQTDGEGSYESDRCERCRAAGRVPRRDDR